MASVIAKKIGDLGYAATKKAQNHGYTPFMKVKKNILGSIIQSMDEKLDKKMTRLKRRSMGLPFCVGCFQYS